MKSENGWLGAISPLSRRWVADRVGRKWLSRSCSPMLCMGVGVLVLLVGVPQPAQGRDLIPDKLVVLTFDDSVKSQFTVVRPVLKQYDFGATFFITEGFDFATNKKDYMTWGEIAQLHRDGFEIGNHTRDHMSLDPSNADHLATQLDQLRSQIEAINDRCRQHGIPRTTSFAYPGNGFSEQAWPILAELGITFARRGGQPEYAYEQGRGFAYEPGLDHPLLVPSAGDARPTWQLEDFVRAVEQAKFGRIAVLQFHGVPDIAHPWVNSPIDQFKAYMRYLAVQHYTVIAMRDLAKYVDPKVTPKVGGFVIDDRRRSLASGSSRDEARRPADEQGLRRWLENMVWHHRFTLAEVRAATGLPADTVQAALTKFAISPETKPRRVAGDPLLVLPYPGGRHPRIGFRDGALRPQRETKISVFLPWDETSYVVVDVPEAIRRNDEATHGLLYLAHTHVDTMWTKLGTRLPQLEWQQHSDGSLRLDRKLPNGVVFGTKVVPGPDAVRMEMWIDNGSDETLSELRVQNCVMLAGAPAFAGQHDDNTVISDPYIARRSAEGNRWIITAWQPSEKVWANESCPCIHSDPRFADCRPGETSRLRGWLSFYEGDDLEGELRRIEASGWSK